MSDPLFSVSFSGENGLCGHVVVDSLVNGTSSGGVRIAPDLELEEVGMLAAEMTFKYAFCGLPRGGAKCGLRLPAGLPPEKRVTALEDAGRRLKAFMAAGIYHPGMDMNCGPGELQAIYKGAGFSLGNLTDTSFHTAVFVAEAVMAAASVLFPAAGSPLTIAVEGFGAVAAHLALRLDRERFRIVAVSTMAGAVYNPDGFDPVQLRDLRRAHGDSLIDHLAGDRLSRKEELLSLPVDFLVPAARVGSIDGENAPSIRARCIVPAANAPCTGEALAMLHGRGIPVLPGFVCNAGGVLGSSLYDRGVPLPQVERMASEDFRSAVASLLRRSLDLEEQPTQLARRIARGVILARRRQSASRTQRILARAAKRFGAARRLVHRNALRDCRRHLALVSGVASRLDRSFSGGPDELSRPDPTVSVIMPVHGTEAYLAEAVRSVLEQTFSDFELIVVDDGSPGDVRGVMAGFDDPRIRLLSLDNRGPASARNSGVRESRGRFVAFLDSDDSWIPDKLARQVALLRDRQDVDVVYTQRSTMDGTSRDMAGFKPRLREGFILDDLYVDNCICMSSAMVRREVFDVTGLLDEGLRMSEDFEFWLRVAWAHAFAAIDEPLVRYRVHPGQVSRNVEERVRVVWEIRREFDRVFGHLVSAGAGRRARALHHAGKGFRAEQAGGGILAVAGHYMKALLHHPLDVPAWKGLARVLLPGALKSALRSGRGEGRSL